MQTNTSFLYNIQKNDLVNLDVLWWGRPYGYWDLVLLTPVRGVRRGLRMWEASLSASPPAAVASMNYIGPLHHWHWINQSDKEQNTPQQCYYTATKGISITVLSFETNARTTELFDLSLYPSMKYSSESLSLIDVDWLLIDCWMIVVDSWRISLLLIVSCLWMVDRLQFSYDIFIQMVPIIVLNHCTVHHWSAIPTKQNITSLLLYSYKEQLLLYQVPFCTIYNGTDERTNRHRN